MVKLLLSGCLFFLVHASGYPQKSKLNRADKQFLSIIDKDFRTAASQYAILAKHLPPGKFPKTYFPPSGSYEFSNASWWCSGFYPGTLLLLFEQNRDSNLYKEALRMLSLLEPQKNNKETHDLGFMMYCSFGNAERLSPDPRYRDILLSSARSLSTRFNEKVGCIRSWNSQPGDFLVIIDNMMNLELLFRATKMSGDSSFYTIAVTHANTTLKNHFRPDNSSYHVVNYNSETGAVQKKLTAQGANDSSAWARGQAWGLYGYTVTYRETKNNLYLQQAKNIAAYILAQLPGDKIPFWDFDAPGIPHALRDASAAAITASALIELSGYVDNKTSKKYLSVAKAILEKLSGPDYLAEQGSLGGFILKHGVGHFPKNSEVDVPLTYADYYFIEALKRYKDLLK
ncbi:MAG: glucuronyl hydrolase [Terrimonas sp.]|nr:glucuronyl hydrolase [Terrimonas sp.]